METKAFNKMKKEELVKAAKALRLEDKVIEIAKDKEAPTNAEYVTVLEEYKKSQDVVNADTKAELDAEPAPAQEDETLTKGKIATSEDKAAHNEVMLKYVVADHDNKMTIEDDDTNTRVFQIGYGNTLTGGKTWSVKLNGEVQGMPIGVAKKLANDTWITKHDSKDAKGNPIAKRIKRFSVTEVGGWTQDEIDALREKQRTRI